MKLTKQYLQAIKSPKQHLYLVWGKSKKSGKTGGQVVNGKNTAVKLKKTFEKRKTLKDWVFFIRKYD